MKAHMNRQSLKHVGDWGKGRRWKSNGIVLPIEGHTEINAHAPENNEKNEKKR